MLYWHYLLLLVFIPVSAHGSETTRVFSTRRGAWRLQQSGGGALGHATGVEPANPSARGRAASKSAGAQWPRCVAYRRGPSAARAGPRYPAERSENRPGTARPQRIAYWTGYPRLFTRGRH